MDLVYSRFERAIWALCAIESPLGSPVGGYCSEGTRRQPPLGWVKGKGVDKHLYSQLNNPAGQKRGFFSYSRLELSRKKTKKNTIF